MSNDSQCPNMHQKRFEEFLKSGSRVMMLSAQKMSYGKNADTYLMCSEHHNSSPTSKILQNVFGACLDILFSCEISSQLSEFEQSYECSKKFSSPLLATVKHFRADLRAKRSTCSPFLLLFHVLDDFIQNKQKTTEK
ncbi:Protein CBG15338 [Caenorhabditis briggsae]|uniref:Protein CBG15338 n=1 Tax=Caenorhabditis briggsae TaxID=6238 RepID=A8XLZ2_CAEBR|nr:Protein CBG15338 [Caenorhabditis briggsae]CAP33667.1 Protein CBG15338 [Caenorhabditis briggsae]